MDEKRSLLSCRHLYILMLLTTLIERLGWSLGCVAMLNGLWLCLQQLEVRTPPPWQREWDACANSTCHPQDLLADSLPGGCLYLYFAVM